MKATTKGQSKEQGQTILMVAVSLFVIVGMAALAIDVVTLYNAHNQAQHAADAAALAGAKALVDSGLTSDPCLLDTAMQNAKDAATAVVAQNPIAGQAASPPTFSFPNIGNAGSCGSPSTFGLFEVNPQITVTVQRTGLPTFFARIFSQQVASVSATATAEGYNPSDASAVATAAVPLSPRCGKPMIFPNCDPGNTSGGSICTGFGTFVDKTTGAITRPGQSPTGVIGEQFTFKAGCGAAANCNSPDPPTAHQAGFNGPLPSIEYYPLALTASVHSCRSCGSSSPSDFAENLACCGGAALQCGSTVPIDLLENPDSGSPSDSELGGECLIHETDSSTYNAACQTGARNTQDCLDTTVYPFRLLAGSSSPYLGSGVSEGDQVSTSDSVAAFPIYDSNPPPPSPVTIVGFLQIFINRVEDPNTSVGFTGTVVNVAGCDTNLTTGSPVQGGATMLPVRLIHQ